MDEAFRAVVQSDTGVLLLSLLRPVVAREVILAALIEDGEERPAYHGVSEGEPDELMSSRDESDPAWWVRGPFFVLLQADQAEGVRCVLQLVDFATERWAETHSSEPNIELLTTGGPVTYLGGPGVYSWYRKHLSGFRAPAPMLTAALSALEKYLYNVVDAGQDVNRMIDTLLNSPSVAVLGVLVALVKRHPRLLENARLLEVIASPQIVLLERQVATDPYPPLGRPQNPEETAAFVEWIDLPHRRRDILGVLMEAFAQEDGIRSNLEHLRSEVIRRAGGEQALTATTRLWAACLDRENYKVDDGPAWGRTFSFVAPAEFVAPSEENTALPFPLFVHRCRRILDGAETLTRDQVKAFWNELQASQRTIESSSGNHLPLLAGAAVLLRTDPAWVFEDPERARWCQQMLVQAREEATRRGPFDPSDFMRMDWDAFAVECLPALWSVVPGDQVLREIVHAVVESGTPSAVGTLVRGISTRPSLDHEFGPLRLLVVRLAVGRDVEERLNHVPTESARLAEFHHRTLAVSGQFLTGTLASERPDLLALKSEAHAVLSEGGQDVTTWPVRSSAVWPAFSWWPAPRSPTAH